MDTSHVSALQQKHAGLEKKLHAEQSRPAPDDSIIKQLKRAKLRVKQELSGI